MQGLTRLCMGLVAATLLTAPAAHAFTFENGGNSLEAPKFDLEEQARAFRKGEPDLTTGKRGYETPFGTMQFGVQRSSPFSSPFGWSGSSASDRQHFERMFAPPHVQDNMSR